MTSLRVSQTALFGHVVRDCMDAAPPLADTETSCQSAVRLLRDNDASAVVVTDGGGRIVGILTKHDVLHRITFRADATRAVRHCMSTPVLTIRDDDYVFHAIASLRRNDLQHLPVLNGQGQVVGMLHLYRVLELCVPRMLELLEQLTREATRDGLRSVKDAQVELAQAMLDDNVAAADVQALLTHINNDIYRRIVERTRSALRDEGWGEAPVELDVIVMGSGGRGESFLFPDQDNGFVLDDYPDSHHGQVDAFVTELAERLTRDLDAVGFPLCRGYVMATNPVWRKSLSQWKTQLDYWLRRPNPATLRLSDIFFDFRSVCGSGRLAAALREHLTGQMISRHHFLYEMERLQQGHGVALSPFNRLIPEHQDSTGEGKLNLNLKYRGLLPLVESVRLLALRAGVSETATLERIASLYDRGVLNVNERDYLTAAFHNLTSLLLRQQLRDYRSDNVVGVLVPLKALSSRERDTLVDSFKAIGALRGRVHSEFTGAVF